MVDIYLIFRQVREIIGVRGALEREFPFIIGNVPNNLIEPISKMPGVGVFCEQGVEFRGALRAQMTLGEGLEIFDTPQEC